MCYLYLKLIMTCCVGQLLERNCSLQFKDGACIILDKNGDEIIKVPMKDKSFSLELQQLNHSVMPTTYDESTLRHKRLGHHHYAGL
uniref:Uncharacterized protein n=1 Tax=Rhizophora mucronata TaxID=61149 RepID=A0A2P2LNU0_RHIMU